MASKRTGGHHSLPCSPCLLPTQAHWALCVIIDISVLPSVTSKMYAVKWVQTRLFFPVTMYFRHKTFESGSISAAGMYLTYYVMMSCKHINLWLYKELMVKFVASLPTQETWSNSLSESCLFPADECKLNIHSSFSSLLASTNSREKHLSLLAAATCSPACLPLSVYVSASLCVVWSGRVQYVCDRPAHCKELPAAENEVDEKSQRKPITAKWCWLLSCW